MTKELKNKPTNINEIIYKKTKEHIPFEELDSSIKFEILTYIKRYKLGIKAFGTKGFDIVKNVFFVHEYVLDDDCLDDINNQTVEFTSFEEFISYVGEEIYNSSCYYGYSFTLEQITKFKLDTSKFNFDSLINYDINQYSFDNLIKEKNEENKEKANLSKKMEKWWMGLKDIKSCDDLSKAYKSFIGRFKSYDSKNIFFSLIHLKYGTTIAQFVSEFLCRNDIYDGIEFIDILIRYGYEWGQYVIEHFNGTCSYTTARSRIQRFKATFNDYNSGTYHSERRCGFEETKQLYYIDDIMVNDDRRGYCTRQYLFSLNDLVERMNGDLTWSDFSKAPIEREQLIKYKTSEKTKFPIEKNYSSYSIEKYYENGEFRVEQKWFDSANNLLLEKKNDFDLFFDFVHFLKKDLSNADLLFCDGIENVKNIKDLNLSNIHLKSEIASSIGIVQDNLPTDKYELVTFEEPSKLELATIGELEVQHPFIDDYNKEISYVTDIHIIHRFFANHYATFDDLDYLIRLISKKINESDCDINLIGGDIASNFGIFKSFVKSLSKGHKKNFIALGNHELWNREGQVLDEVINEYKELSKLYNFYLVQNNAYVFRADGIEEITTEELINETKENLRIKTQDVYLIIFGGIGFSCFNNKFNANNGIYRGLLTREQEIEESNKFSALYSKVVDCFYDKNVIVLTHMPMQDWLKEEKYQKGFVYVNGHNHRNYYYDDGETRIYSDNQIGYKQKEVNLKKLSINYEYNWFANYKDGIYEITKDDYEHFYRGIRQRVTFNREFKSLYMLKREETYMFILKTQKDTLQILNGGSIKNAGNHDLQYFYDNLVNYSKSVQMFLKDFDAFQKEISKEIKKIGGDGTIHGSIVDIDFYNHLYLNPLDGKITPYFAYSITDKYVYKNLLSLLKFECPELYRNYQKLISTKKEGKFELVCVGNNYKIVQKKTYVSDTSMYKVSRILRGLQFTTNYNVVRLWNDSIIADCSAESGRLIVGGIINPKEIEVIQREEKERIKTEKKLLNPPKPKVEK